MVDEYNDENQDEQMDFENGQNAEDETQNINNKKLDLSKIYGELTTLKKNIEGKENLNDEDKEALGNIDEAINGADEEDEGKVKGALKKSAVYIFNYAANYGLEHLSWFNKPQS